MHIRYVGDIHVGLFVNFQPRETVYMKYISQILERLPTWREERLPPPRVNQSEVMKVVNFSRTLKSIGIAV